MKFKIGKNASIHLGCRFNTSGFFSMGANSTINQYCHMDNRGGIYIGNNVSISAQVSIVTADHDFEDEMCIARKDEVVIEDYVFIGYGAKIFKNVKMHYGSVLGGASLQKIHSLMVSIMAYRQNSKKKEERI
jgi:acetyltransferase-like isoleucine patch superfamily enzyme